MSPPRPEILMAKFLFAGKIRGMESKHARAFVTVLAWVFILGGTASIVFPLEKYPRRLLWQQRLRQLMTRSESDPTYSPMLRRASIRIHLETLVYAISGTVFLFSGIGLLRRKRWARTMVAIIFFLFAVYFVWYAGWRTQNVVGITFKIGRMTPLAMIALGAVALTAFALGIICIWAVGRLYCDAAAAEFAWKKSSNDELSEPAKQE
jgi:hypothetical protein